ncbi:lipoyltransferase [Pyrenochaeta sp. DS3sAY3a]|nr:lipoyltransferase [Pyrenochaeta sp. DS3sAY3a]
MASALRQKLIHIHIPGIVPYATASRIQESLVSRFLDSKAHPTTPPPPPHLLTAQFQPVYTCGRREIGNVSPEQQAFLRADGRADFVEAMRGGQTTFHGPGQLIAYPILDLREHKLNPRSYVSLLEETVIAVCSRWGIPGMTTENTGVWTTPDDKIASIGVHMRRNITSHGVALNLTTDLQWFERIAACGLKDKSTTSFEVEGIAELTVEEAGEEFAEELSYRMDGVDGWEKVDLRVP